jgi:hypothetical protein
MADLAEKRRVEGPLMRGVSSHELSAVHSIAKLEVSRHGSSDRRD